MHLRKRKRMGVAWCGIGLALLLAGCTPASRLAGLAQQNQENIARYDQDTKAAILLLDEFVDRSCDVFIDGRIGYFSSQLNRAIGTSDTDVISATDWSASLLPEYKTKYDELKAALSMSHNPDLRASLLDEFGWLVTAVEDPDFTPGKAKQLQRQLEQLKQVIKQAGHHETFREEAATLIATVDPSVDRRLELVGAIKEVKDQLTDQLAQHSLNAKRHAAALIGATEASASFSATIESLLGNQDTQAIIGGLVNSTVNDQGDRDAVLALLRDTSILRENASSN